MKLSVHGTTVAVGPPAALNSKFLAFNSWGLAGRVKLGGQGGRGSGLPSDDGDVAVVLPPSHVWAVTVTVRGATGAKVYVPFDKSILHIAVVFWPGWDGATQVLVALPPDGQGLTKLSMIEPEDVGRDPKYCKGEHPLAIALSCTWP